nr:hypothetical protein [Capsulimonas corticalis]
MPMIIDAFPFFNELDILEIRLAELMPVVDRFLLVEATETFSGKPKPLYFEVNKERFAGFPIEHVIIDKFPDDLQGPWARENYPRHLMRERLELSGLSQEDVVMLSDLDEIPRAEAVARYARTLQREVPGTVYVFEQHLSYYFVNYRVNEPWYGTRMARWQDIADMQRLRESQGAVIRNGGWHFSYAGGVQAIREKVAGSAHTEFDRPAFLDEAHIERCMAAGTDLFGRGGEGFTCVPLDETFPAAIARNRERYNHLVFEKPAEARARDLYVAATNARSDISEHLPYLFRLASTVNHVTEMGTRTGQSTAAFVHAGPKRIVAYDLVRHQEVDKVEQAAIACGIDFIFHEQDVLQAQIEDTDLLFLDTWHVEEQMRQELALHAGKARRFIVLHDTQTFADLGETAVMGGVWPPITDFLRASPEWHILEHFPNNNGLTVLARSRTAAGMMNGEPSEAGALKEDIA